MDFVRQLGWKTGAAFQNHDWHTPVAATQAYYNAVELFPWAFQDTVEDQVMDYRAAGGAYVSTSSCTGNASGTLLEYEKRKKTRQPINISRLGVYALGRKKRGWLGQDQGAVISDCFEQLAVYGCCLESFHPFRPEFLFKDLDVYAYAQAARHRITNVRQVRRDDVQATLNSGQLVVVGLNISQKVWFQEARQTGFARLVTPSELDGGGHALCVAGYDFEGRLAQWTGGVPVIFGPNSWGPGWGSKSPIRPGWWIADARYLTDPKLSGDFMTATLAA